MARTLPNSKINPRKIDADKAYNRIANRADGQTFKELEDQPGPQPSQAHTEFPQADPAGAKGALDE